MANKKTVVKINDIQLSFRDELTRKYQTVLRGAGFELYEGEILGIIGESGSGKSVITSLINGINPQNMRIDSGNIHVFDEDVTNWKSKDWIKSTWRGKRIGKVFQNPMSVLNPVLKIRTQLLESLLDYKIYKDEWEAEQVVIDLLKGMNIQNPEALLKSYPHELSGGMIQRVVITMVLAAKPEIIIFDEPTTALDPIVQAEILKIIKDINKKTKVSMIFITHDIGVIAAIADRIVVMYAGVVVEHGNKNQILFNSYNPYTWGLLCSLPAASSIQGNSGIKGMLDISSLKPNQDVFAHRNPYAMKIDLEEKPPLFKVEENHYSATWLLHKDAPKVEKPKFIKELNKYYKKGK